jgi:VanZ family protein
LSTNKQHLIKSWIAAILWLIVIALESSTYLSANNTSKFLYPLLHFLFKINHPTFETWHHYIRKGGHVFGYGLLSILLFRAWRDTLPAPANRRWTLRWSYIAVLATCIVASLDEWHQYYLPTRTGRWQDIILDTSAGIAAQVLLFVSRGWW